MNLFLTENRYLRFASFAVFYIAQGLPIGLISIALPAWLAQEGIAAGEIATFVAISSLPWGFKLLAGPVMDRFSFLGMGRRRPWVVAAQFGLLLSVASMSLVPDPVQNVLLLTWVAFLVNCFASVQDVAVDGMAIDVLPADERGRANSFMAFGQVAGYSVSGALCATMLITFGVPGAAVMLTAGLGIIFLWGVIVRERRGEKILPWTDGQASERSIELQADNWGSIARNLNRVLFLKVSILLIIVTFSWRVAAGFWLVSAPVIAVQELGYESTDYSYWTSTFGAIAALLGLLLGPVIDRIGAKHIFFLALIGLGITFLLTGLAVPFWSMAYFPLVVLCCESFFGQAIFISFIALHMTICWNKVSATQFAIYMAWSNLARSIGASIYGEIQPNLAFGQEFIIMGFIVLSGAFVLSFVRLDRHEEYLQELDGVVLEK